MPALIVNEGGEMTIEKAIKYIQEMADCGEFIRSRGYLDALKLGIEALKREEHYREVVGPERTILLPGETEE